jgi:hypothetical protein
VIFSGDIFEGEIDIEECCVDRGMAHELLHNGERNFLPDEIGAEGVAKAMRMNRSEESTLLSTGSEYFSQALEREWFTSMLAFANEKTGGGWTLRSFDGDVCGERLYDPRGDREETLFSSLSQNANGGRIEIEVVDLQTNDLAGSKANAEHECEDCAVSMTAKSCDHCAYGVDL